MSAEHPSKDLAERCTDLERQNRKLVRQLERSLKNRLRLEDHKERNDSFLRQIIEEMREAQKALEASEQAAQQASRAKSEFLANISHEIRTPMNAVLGMTELLLSGQLGQEQRRLVEAAHEAGRGLLSLINDVLDLSKAEAGHLQLDTATLDLRHIVESVVSMFSEKAATKGLELGSCISPEVPRLVIGDPGRVRQVLLNLLGNAMKFTHKGSVIVSVEVESWDGPHAQLCCSITDTGIGISEDVQRRLFQPFVQADGSMTRKYGGTGLGLSICRDLARLMGGDVTVASTDGEGSTFMFRASLEACEEEDRSLPDISSLERKRLFVAHAHPDSGRGLCFQARALGVDAVLLDLNKLSFPAQEQWQETLLVDRTLSLEVLDKLGELFLPREGGQTVVIDASCSMSRQSLPGDLSDWLHRSLRLPRPPRLRELREALEVLWDGGKRRDEHHKAPILSEALEAKILVVEDNPVNQMMAEGMLRRLGCHVQLANNGQEGFEAWSRGDFDLVLMDCQMPVCDGFQGTALIRAREEGQALPRTPVVALTAHAMAGDRERCLDAGMDDYLTKPFTLVELRDMVKQWQKDTMPSSLQENVDQQAPPARTAQAPVGAGAGPNPEIIQPEAWRVLFSMEEGQPGMAHKVLQCWDDDATQVMESLAQALAQGDGAAIGRLAHSFKSSSAYVGAHKVAAICKSLEQLAQLGIIASMPPLLEALDEVLQEARQEIEAFRGITQTTTEAPQGFQDTVVMVVDDDATIRQIACSALGSLGCTVHEAINGTQALEMFDKVQPHLILLDVVMGEGPSGFDVCAHVRLHHDDFDVPVLLMTGLDDVDSIQRAYNTGATDFITKPFNPHIIRHRVRYMLKMRTAAIELRNREAQLEAAHRVAGVGSWLMNAAGHRTHISPRTLQLLGVPEESAEAPLEWMHQHVITAERPRVLETLETLHEGGACQLLFKLRLPNGEVRVIQEHAEQHYDAAGRPSGILGTVIDVTAQVKAQERIHNLAYYDGVTGLPNRELFMERLCALLTIARQTKHMLGVLFIDIDRFKRVNDTLGHSMGDRLLQGVGDRFRELFVGNNVLAGKETLLARFGGDEFVLMVDRLASRQELESIANILLEVLREPFVVGEHELVASVSIGTALFPEDGEDAESLLKNTDQAMYQVKEKGGNGFGHFNGAKGGQGTDRLLLEAEIRHALAEGQFELFYQPKVDIQSWRLVGTEALIRWRHPQRGLVSPFHFISLAEETGLIIPMGEWALGQACRDARAWLDMGLDPGRVAVNLSPKQFRQKDLIEKVQESLSQAKLDPSYLELEVTESMVMDNLDEAISVLRQLRSMGISVSVDDFGTGHSSLNYLRRLPIDTLKIDRSFIMGAEKPGSDEQVIAATIIALGQTLRLDVIAEGVETLPQLRFLQDAGCHEIQGYLISKPVPFDELTQFVSLELRSMLKVIATKLAMTTSDAVGSLAGEV